MGPKLKRRCEYWWGVCVCIQRELKSICLSFFRRVCLNRRVCVFECVTLSMDGACVVDVGGCVV